jgi:hypothetical protein
MAGNHGTLPVVITLPHAAFEHAPKYGTAEIWHCLCRIFWGQSTKFGLEFCFFDNIRLQRKWFLSRVVDPPRVVDVPESGSTVWKAVVS